MKKIKKGGSITSFLEQSWWTPLILGIMALHMLGFL